MARMSLDLNCLVTCSGRVVERKIAERKVSILVVDVCHKLRLYASVCACVCVRNSEMIVNATGSKVYLKINDRNVITNTTFSTFRNP